MSTNNLSDEVVLPELYFLIAHFLNNSPFKDSAKNLIDQLHQNNVLPKRIDWNGNEHPRSFDEILKSNSHIPPNFLLQICNQLRSLFDSQLKINFTQVNSLLGAGQFSVLQDFKQVNKKFCKSSNLDALPKDFYVKFHSENKNYFNYSTKKKNGGINLLLNLQRNEIVGRMRTQNVIQPELFRTLNIHKRILGHLSAVYCVCFDRSGKYILTGADDDLIKVWSACDSRLLATLRGHEKEISDIDINFENTLLASGSCDKSIRIWNLKTTESTTVLQGHSAMVTSLEFSPYCREKQRWLASSGNDGAICFWSWNSETLTFNSKPKKFIEKSRPGAQMLCISFSSGGSFLAAGSNDHVIRVYFFDENDPIKVCELESHTNFVDSIQYANTSARFLSGSKDGTAKIWKYENLKWKAKLIDASVTLVKTDLNNSPSLLDICKKPTVTMVTWNCDDSVVVTAQNNFLIKVWNGNNVQLIHELKGHSDEIFVLEAHPRDPRLLLSSGHDGYVIIWNILSGRLLRKFYNRIENEGHGCLFDTKWSPSNDMLAATDSHGYLTIFGFGSDETYKHVPNEQFFHTDYRPLMRDSNDFVVDEQTQQPVHLMQPPFLVNADGNPYELEYQRLVPGRENLTDAQLNPQVITNERGLPEIINMDVDDEDQAAVNNPNSNGESNERRGNFYVRNLISPIDIETITTSEQNRLNFLEEEETYFIEEYRKELKLKELAKSNRNDFDFFDFDQNSNQSKRRRGGKRSKNISEANCLETTIKNRLTTAALFDTDHEDDSEREPTKQIILDHMDEETMDDGQYIDVDEDSTTQHSQLGFPASSNGPTTSSRANNSRAMFSSRSNYSEPPESENSDSSEYSDWAEEDGKKTLKPPPRKTQQKTIQPTRSERAKRRLRIQEDDEDEVVEVEEESFVKPKQTTLSSKLKKIISDDDDEEEENVKTEQAEAEEDDSEDDSNEEYSSEENENSDKPCTSQAAHARNFKSPSKRGRRSKKKNRQNTSISKSRSFSKKLNESVQNKSMRSKTRTNKNTLPAHLNECPLEYRPPEWLTSTKPKKSPYVPQMGDEVVYFRQGHELYVNAVKNSKAYELDETSLPWNTHEIDVQEYCRVIGMKVEIKPPRLVCLKLGIIDEKTGDSTGVKFSIKYHDMPHVVDFVILRQFYEKAIQKNWRPADRFRSIIDDNWYFGVIESKTPFQEEYPKSYFQCLNVFWDSSDKEALSPWDLEPLCGVNARKTKPVASAAVPENGEGLAVTSEEIKDLLYSPTMNEWPGVGRDYECERILNGLQKIMELSIAEPFNFPVDLDSFPNYAIYIDYPIDLNTIRERLDNRYYRRVNSIQWDVRKIETNAAKFNQPKSEIVKKATLLTELLLEFINDTECTNPIPIYKKLDRNRNQSVLEETPNSSIYNTRPRTRTIENYNENSDNEMNPNYNHTNKSLRNKKSSKQANSIVHTESRYNRRKTEADSWIHECKKLINDIYKHNDAEAFIMPVDIIEYEDYYRIIDEPISFSEIREKLEANQYAELKDFDRDCKLLFQNSKTYNTNKRSPIYIMTQRLNSLYDSRISIIKADHQSAIEHEAAMLSKYSKNRLRKIKHASSIAGEKTSKQRVLNNADLISDQHSSPSFHPGILTRSSSHRKTKNSYLTSASRDSTAPTTSKSANMLNKSFDEGCPAQMVGSDFTDTENDMNKAKSKLEASGSSEANNSSLMQASNHNRRKRNVLNSDSDSDCNYKTAASNLNSKRSKVKTSFKIEPNQNANMGFTSEENFNNTNEDIQLSFRDLISKKKDSQTGSISAKHDAKISSSEYGESPKKLSNGRKNKKYVENYEEDEFDDLDEDDDKDDNDYEVENKSLRSKRKTNSDAPVKRGRRNLKNLDDKENEDDYDHLNVKEKSISNGKTAASSSKYKRNSKSSKRARTSIRNKKPAASYKETTSSSEESSPSDSFDSETPKKSSTKRRKKKARRSSSRSDQSEASEKSPKKKQNTFDDDDDVNNDSSDFDTYSNELNSGATCSSRLRSRGRLLKTVPQY